MNILISYFDPFQGRTNNNSAYFAKLVKANLESNEIKVSLCELRTVYDKAYDILDDCVRSSSDIPDMVISLGESGCKKITIETRGINLDKSYGPDNDGIERDNTEIYPGEEKYLGVTLPVDKAYCGLTKKQMRSIQISSSAGSFVCNNTLYHGLRNFQIPYTFIHVPNAKCSSVSKNNKLGLVLSDYIANLTKEDLVGLIQPKNISETKEQMQRSSNDCHKKFYKKLLSDY